MKKSIINIGNTLSKAEQRAINGGLGDCKILPYTCAGHCSYCYEEFIWNEREACFDNRWVCVTGGGGGIQ